MFFLQLQSFETELSVPKLAEKEGGTDTCRGVFIRAPAILEVGPNVEIIAYCPLAADQPKVMIPSINGEEVLFYKLCGFLNALFTIYFIKKGV